MWHAPTKTGRAKYDPDGTVLLLNEANKVEGSGRIEDAIERDRAVIIDRLRPDLVCIDFDHVPKALVRRFVRQHLAGKVPFVLLPSGGRSVRLLGSRKSLRRYHLFAIAAHPEIATALGEVTREIGRAIRQRAKDETWRFEDGRLMRDDVEVKVRRAIRGPLFAHRFSSATRRLRRYSRKYPEVLPAIFDVFDTPCSWTDTELEVAKLRRPDVAALPGADDGATKLSAARRADLLAVLDSFVTRHDMEEWGDAVRLVNRLDLRGFSAEQVWQHREHSSLRQMIHGRYGKPVSERAAWKTLSRMFEDAARTRPQRRHERLPLREDVLRAAVLSLQGAQLKAAVAALLMEREEPMRFPRSKRTFKRSVKIGQAALAECAGIASSATINKIFNDLVRVGWFVKGPIRPLGQAQPFALVIPRSVRSKLKYTGPANVPCRGGDQRGDRGKSERSKVKHNSHLPLKKRKSMECKGEGGGRGRGDSSLRQTLGALLEKRAVRVRGLPASALQIILADLLNIDRCDLPLSRATMSRAVGMLRETGVLDQEDRLAPDFLEVLEVYAVERHLAEAADRQAENHQARRVSLQVKFIMAKPTPRLRRGELKALQAQNELLGDQVRRRLEEAYGSEWHKNSAS